MEVMEMSNSSTAKESFNTIRIVGRIDVNNDGEHNATFVEHGADGEFLESMAAGPAITEAYAEKETRRVLAELAELKSEKRWDDMVALFHPVEEKVPEAHEAGTDSRIREQLAFALCRLGRHEDAVECMKPVVEREPEDVMGHYNLAYAAFDLLFTVKRDRSRLNTPARRKEFVALAHRHFERCQKLRPDSVTFFYRDAMLYKEIEDKPRKAIPLFMKAISNWERLSPEEQRKRHQQRPKYVKSLYHIASSYLATGMAARSLEYIERAVDEDKDRNFISPVFKHYALGKVLYALGKPSEALEHLDTAVFRAEHGQALDYIYELSARCALKLDNTQKALEYISKIPVKKRRPYVRWTEADILCAAGHQEQAISVLHKVAERDRRSRHVSLIRLARIEFSLQRYENALTASEQAARFCADTFGSPSNEALFWKAAALFRLGGYEDALEILEDLNRRRFHYPNFRKMLEVVRKCAGTAYQKAMYDSD
jgi:tetratricopeptide (TPR) repeat protein